MPKAELKISPEQWSLQGSVGLDNVVALRAEGERQLLQSQDADIELDLSQLQALDSSPLTLLLCWQRCASANSKTLRLRGANTALQTLLQLYGLQCANASIRAIAETK